MRVLAITKIFPNSLEPTSSPFNRQQFAELSKLCDLEVIVAIPHFPTASVTGQPPRAAKLAGLPSSEIIDGVKVHYMRQLYVPAIGLPVAVPLYVASLLPFREKAKDFDVILATWAYPDGCASVLFALSINKPCVVKVHGSDLNVLGKKKSANRYMTKCLPRAEAMVAVASAQKQWLMWKRVEESKIHVVPNGIDTKLFYPRDRAAARAKLALPLDRPMLLFVGRLEPEKGVLELLTAFEELREKKPGLMLALVGDGVSRDKVAEAKARLGDALITPGAIAHAEIADWMAACDVFVLPSWAEGSPNVVLEALASGRPPVGTRVGGIPEIITDGKNGILARPKDPRGLAISILSAFARTWDPKALRASAPISWAESATKLYGVLEGAIAAHRAAQT